jgi:cytochrome c-type biogenesis protein CcmH/NrfF
MRLFSVSQSFLAAKNARVVAFVLFLSCVSCQLETITDSTSEMAKELATSSRAFAVDAFHVSYDSFIKRK